MLAVGPPRLQAEPVFFPQHQQEFNLHSGDHRGPAQAAAGPQSVFRHTIRAPGAAWLRIHLANHKLGTKGYVTFRSLEDGAVQRLDARSIQMWQNSTAYFNGDAVEVELFAAPGEDGIFVAIDRLVVGDRVGGKIQDEGGIESLCGADNRVASTDAAVGRINGCTAWLTSNGSALTAGHCCDFDPDQGGSQLPDGVLDLAGVISFDVPLSDPDGTPNASAPEDQYPINTSGVQWRFDGEGQGLGKDWCVFGVFANTTNGDLPHITRGFKRMTRENPAVNNTIRVTGYGVDTGTANRTEQTSTGPYVSETISGSDISHRYQVDTQGANSGSPIIWESNQFAIGIHTNAGCQPDGTGSNSGTSFEVNALETALAGFPGSNSKYVDAVQPPTSPAEDGSVFRPWNTVTEGVTNVVSGGRVVIVEGSYTAATGNTFTAGADGKSFLFLAPVGIVVIGN